MLGLKIVRPEGVTLTGITILKSLPEPAHALLGTAVGKRIRCDIASGFALQAIITDGAGRI
jgi:hypothetical protein